MPRFDGTGPNGQGMRTGGSRGFCNPSNGTATDVGLNRGGCCRRGGGGRGLGMGSGRGFGVGFGKDFYQDKMDSIIERVDKLEKSKE